MKGAALILFLLWHAALHAQQPVQTIVPLQPISVGAAFQVQYIVTGNEPVLELQSPAFGRSFRFVSGPRLYQGEALINNKKTAIQNFTYTLIPLRKGRLVVKGATVVFPSGKKKSDDTFIIVTDKIKDDPLLSTPISDLPRLAPGSTWNEKLQQQIFVKASVSKKSCFVGEPVAATFTLFSRLPSASEVIKNPGFYGFSVLEIPSAAEGAQTVQTHNGSFYNTHILRHVQLYPAQPGNLVIDKMSVNNAIEYTDSATGAPVQTTAVLESEPIMVAVKSLPATTDPAFLGAVGRFTINAYLENQKWRQNNTGKLTLTISGTGNFLQFAAPEIRWPAGVTVFDTLMVERLQKEAVPVAGTRTYTYTFTTDSTGKHFIAPISFTYFDPGAKRYRTAVTDSLHFTVQKRGKGITLPTVLHKNASNPHAYIWLIVTAAIAASAFLFYKRYRVRKKKNTVPIPERTHPDFEKQILDISPDDDDAYRQLQQALMGFLKSSWPNESDLASLQQVNFEKTGIQKAGLQIILDECEAVQYYNAVPTIPFDELKQQALAFIRAAKSV